MKNYNFKSSRVVGGVRYEFLRWKDSIRWNLKCEVYDINSGKRIAFRGLWESDNGYKKMIKEGIWLQDDIENYMIELIKPVIKRKITYLKKTISDGTDLLNLLETTI